MKEIEYYLMNPTGNITILVISPVAESLQPALAAELMKVEPTAEQVGFISYEDSGAAICLRMAGGEFCGNATLCAAALYMKEAGLEEEAELLVRVSGVKDLVTVHMLPEGQGIYAGTVAMPKVQSVVALPAYAASKVDLGGIIHVVTEAVFSDQQAEELVKRWAAEWQADAVGLMQVNLSEGSMRPLVYVATANTLFWENSCASGTSAVGAAFAYKNQKAILLTLKQPGGSLTVDAGPDGQIYLSGRVITEEKKRMKKEP